ncbi:MAG: excinuclease ABC subunit UvrC [Chitinophagales bacterium]
MNNLPGEEIKASITLIPNKPGVYEFYDTNKNILYVGKAKKLKKRVQSYFQKEHNSARLKLLVKKISSIEFTTVATDQEAFLLENNLIKELQPKYNIQLKDDKSYPYIVIRNEPIPRLYFTRRKVQDGSEYFGPYTGVKHVRAILNLAKELHPLRTCKLDLSPSKIQQKKYKVCLEYHIGNCLAPCIGEQSAAEYDEGIDTIRKILEGKTGHLIETLTERRNQATEELNYELAHDFQKKIEKIQEFKRPSLVENLGIERADVYQIVHKENGSAIHHIKIREYSIVFSTINQVVPKLHEEDDELLLHAIRKFSMAGDLQSIPPIIAPIDLDFPFAPVIVPERGEKNKILLMMKKNLMEHQFKTKPKLNQDLLEQIQKDLRLSSLPKHIECFDNSNIQGSNPVASCVVFVNGRPAKSAYRHFNVKTVVGPDDYASMTEIVKRRYTGQLKKGESLPDLIVIDGGKGQLNAAIEALKEVGIYQDVAVIGIAKQLEELFYPNDPLPLMLNKRSPALKLMQQIRNEAHRFAITFHRKKRSQHFTRTSLESIQGIGEKTAIQLLRSFGSIEAIKKAPFQEIASIIGQKKAQLIKAGLD